MTRESKANKEPCGQGEAARLYSELLRRRQAGEKLDLEAFCVLHPEHSAGLRLIHSVREESQHEETCSSFGELLRKEMVAERHQMPVSSIDGVTRYSIRGEVGRGGMGLVLKVWDESLQRPLAMKVLYGKAGLAPDGVTPPVDHKAFARFLREAQITGQLDHPGVVPVHELCFDSEVQVFFTMRLVQGRDLKVIFDLARRGAEGWSPTRALGALLKVCETLAFAHSRGVVHRDIKPENIMVGSFGEVYVMDWGLAKVLPGCTARSDRLDAVAGGATAGLSCSLEAGTASDHDDPLVTVDGSILGTPAYMPPEQAAGDIAEVDARSDVYSVGAMLYTLLSDQSPYVRPGAPVSSRDILSAVIQGPPIPVEQLEPRASPELVAVCEKAMARSKVDRYQTARELADDLQAYLENRVVRAYETGALAELRKWIRRNKGTALSLAAATVLALTGLVAVLAVQAVANRDLAVESAAKEKALGLAETRLADYRRLADVKRLSELKADADRLWPALPDRVPGLEKWIGAARDLGSRLKTHRKTLSLLREKAVPSETRESLPRAWTFRDAEDQWLHDTLAELVAGLEELVGEESKRGLLASVEDRLQFARTVRQRTISDHEKAWEEASRSISDVTECPKYQGLRIRPQLGLVPIGRDPQSGLWEFAHIATGEPPGQGPDGKLRITEASGLVLILLPPGTFRMGSSRPGPDAPDGSPNVDLEAEPQESPVHAVILKGFFLSKYEMTQAQWLRFTGENPSVYGPEKTFGGKQHSLLHPVENVSFQACEVILLRLGLVIPTEAEWEYAVRGGTSTVWWTGGAKESLAGAANLADRFCKEHGGYPTWKYDEWLDDGYVGHAPVGTYRANAFGLHDVCGNVWEWCRDWKGSYASPVRDGDGERQVPQAEATRRILRGAGFTNTAKLARSALRFGVAPGFKDESLGIRPARELDLEEVGGR